MKLQIREIDHVVLRVRDMERMVRFYAEVLGAELVAGDPGGGRNMDHLCLRIEPFDEAGIVAHLKAHDVPVGDIRTRYGAEGNGVSIYLTDPEGNQVELKGPSDGKPPPD